MDTLYIFISLAMSVLLGTVCSKVASEKKGRHPVFWFWMGFLFGIIAFVVLLFLPPQKNTRHVKQQITPTFHYPAEKNLTDNPSVILPTQWYYISLAKEQKGPMSLPLLLEALEHGDLRKSSYVWNETLPDWKKLSDLKDIADHLVSK